MRAAMRALFSGGAMPSNRPACTSVGAVMCGNRSQTSWVRRACSCLS